MNKELLPSGIPINIENDSLYRDLKEGEMIMKGDFCKHKSSHRDWEVCCGIIGWTMMGSVIEMWRVRRRRKASDSLSEDIFKI